MGGESLLLCSVLSETGASSGVDARLLNLLPGCSLSGVVGMLFKSWMPGMVAHIWNINTQEDWAAWDRYVSQPALHYSALQ